MATINPDEKPFLYAVEHTTSNGYIFDTMRKGLFSRPAPAKKVAKELFKKAIAECVSVQTSVVPLYKERNEGGGTTGKLIPKANDPHAFTQKWPVERPTLIRSPRG